MSIKNWPGGVVRKTPVVPAGPYQDGAASGVWTLEQQAYWLKQGLWPIAGNVNTADRGLFFGGNNGSNLNIIDYVSISSAANAVDFGDLSLTSSASSGTGSSTRGVIANGDFGTRNVIEYVTLATVGNTTDFGDLTVGRSPTSSAGNSTRAIFSGGFNGSAQTNIMDYVTIATTGNATDFGDIYVQCNHTASASSPTRLLVAGGFSNVPSATYFSNIGYVTIATTGNTASFGTLDQARQGACGFSSATRCFFSYGRESSGAYASSTTVTVTTATLGNATYWADLSNQVVSGAGCSNATRGLVAGGYSYTSSSNINVIESVSLSSLGVVADFGDLTVARQQVGGLSGSGGGLQ